MTNHLPIFEVAPCFNLTGPVVQYGTWTYYQEAAPPTSLLEEEANMIVTIPNIRW